MVEPQLGSRFATGDACIKPGRYRWDGYLEPDGAQPPRPDELEIILRSNQPFPQVASTGKAAYWRFDREDDSAR